MALSSTLRDFPNISHFAFQHPLDRQALAALEKVPLLPGLVKKFNSMVGEKFLKIEHVSNNLRVSADQYPSLHKQYVRMAQVLDLPKIPDLYIDTTPEINAYATGTHDYFIVVNSGLIDLMSEDELLAVIGHELGHVKCQHMLYKTMTYLLQMAGVQLIDALLPGVGWFAAQGVLLALLEWNRKAEFSCDRAGALCTQNPESMQSALAKLGGYSGKLQDGLNIEAIKAQAAEYEEIGSTNVVEKMMKVYALLQRSHPHPVVRVKELETWALTGPYAQIMAGDYETRKDAPPEIAITPIKVGAGFCPACGTAHAKQAAFCSKCGQALETAAAAV